MAAALASVARAHVGHVIARAERYLKLDASEADTRIVVSLMLGADEGARVLATADGDGDRIVSPQEAQRYLEQWAQGLQTELPVRVDGSLVEVRWTDGWFDPIGRVRRTSLTLELVAHLPLDRREHLVEVEDRMVRREVFDRTDIAFRAHDGAELVTCGTSIDASQCEDRDIAFVRGASQPDRLAARLRFAGRSALPSWLAPTAVGAAVVAATALAVAARCRRARPQAQGPSDGAATRAASDPQIRNG